MTGWLKKSTSVSVVIGPVWATADGSLKADLAYNASGINCDVYKNGTKADVTLANSAGDGYFRAGSGESLYLLTLSTGHTDTLGMFTISLSATGYYMKPQHYMVVPANVWDSMFGSDMLKCEVVEISGDTAAADNLESYCDGTTPIPANAIQISGDATAADNCELMFDGTGYAGGTTKLAVEVNTKTGFSLANGSIAAATFAAGAVDAAALAADAGTEIGAAVKTAVEAAGSHLALIKAKTDSLTFTGSYLKATLDGEKVTLADTQGYYAPAKAGDKMDLIDAPNATALTAIRTTMQAAGQTLATLLARIVGTLDTGTHKPQSGDAYGVVNNGTYGNSKLAKPGDAMTLTGAYDAAKTAAPTAAENADAVWDEAVADHAGVGSTGAGLAAAGSAGDPWSTALPGAYGAGTAGSHLALIKAKTDNLPASPAATGAAMTLADDAITAAKFDESTAFPLKSADTGATAVARTGAGSDTLETLSDEIAAVTAPTAAAVADAVWDEAVADHAGVGSTGAALAAAGGSGDPWATALPGAYGAGTAGYVLGTQGATGSGLSAVPWNAAWDAEVQSECTDALNAYDPPTKAELDAADDATLTAIAALSIPTATENADALLNRDMSAVSDTTARSPLNALRQLRNRVAIADGTMTVYEEDDTTEAWTGAVTTSASVEPITEIDPA